MSDIYAENHQNDPHVVEYSIMTPDGHFYRGTNGPDVWTSMSEREARQMLAACNVFEKGHRLCRDMRSRQTNRRAGDER